MEKKVKIQTVLLRELKPHPSGGSKFKNFILILQLVFVPERFEHPIGI